MENRQTYRMNLYAQDRRWGTDKNTTGENKYYVRYKIMLNLKLLANQMKANAKEENPKFETYRAYVDKDTTYREAKDIDFFMTQWITKGYITIKSSDDAIKYKRVRGES